MDNTDKERTIKLIAYYNWLNGSKNGPLSDYYEAEKIYNTFITVILYYKSISDG